MESKQETITVVGAGLVGSLLSIFLARRGYQVELLERRSDMRKTGAEGGRSINLAVSTRGLAALDRLGLKEKVLEHAVAMKGRMMHAVNGELTFLRYGKDDSECIYSISRGDLNQFLMTEAEQTKQVRISFEQKVLDADLANRILKLESGELPYSRVIGTDGSASAIRKAMATHTGSTVDESYLNYGYKELTIPAGKNGSFSIEKNALHIWPRGTYMLIALPNFDGSFTCTLFLPFEGEISFAQLQNKTQVQKFFESYFPDASRLIPNLAENYFENPVGKMVTVKCFPSNYRGEVLLLGDAAHSIVPFFGQGMNCGFEDCSKLDLLFSKPDFNWERDLTQYSRERKPNTDAIADMAVENFVEMRDKVADPKFLLEKGVEKLLQSHFPGEYLSRYSLVTFSQVPYRTALEAGKIEDEILAELCQGISHPQEVNLKTAEIKIRQKLSPFLKSKGTDSAWI